MELMMQSKHILTEKYNIEIIHQVPRSPLTNALDRGVWDQLQSGVQKQYVMIQCSVNALVSYVNTMGNNRSLDKYIQNMFMILEKCMFDQ